LLNASVAAFVSNTWADRAGVVVGVGIGVRPNQNPSLELGENPDSVLFVWVWKEPDPIGNGARVLGAVGELSGEDRFDEFGFLVVGSA
jgi:hypothetical protein